METADNSMETAGNSLSAFIPLYSAEIGGSSVQTELRDIFPSNSSLKWFSDKHKEALVEGEAMLMVRGSWHGDPAKWRAILPDLLRADTRALLIARTRRALTR